MVVWEKAFIIILEFFNEFKNMDSLLLAGKPV